MQSKIYRRIPECDPELVQQAAKYSVSDLHESMDLVSGQMALFGPEIRPLNPGIRIAGQAVTVFSYPQDGLFGHKAVQLVRPGQILVMSNGGRVPQLMFGEMIAMAALKAGAVGAVVEGYVRDVEALRQMRFPVWSSGVYAGHIGKDGPGSVNMPVVCGGVLVHPGDVIIADDDGVICIPPVLLPGVLEKAAARKAREMKARAAIGEGKVLFDLAGMQAAVDASGVEEIDGVWQP